MNTITKKLIFVIGLVFIVSIVIISVFLGLYVKKQLEEKIIKNRANFLSKTVNNKINERLNVLKVASVNIANSAVIARSILENNRELAFNRLNEVNADLSKIDIFTMKYQIHTADLKSFLRSWIKDKYGDDLSWRSTLNAVKSSKINISTIEVGRDGINLRSISPIIRNNEYVGSVEVIAGIDGFEKDFMSEKLKYIMIIKKDLLDKVTLGDTLKVSQNFFIRNDKNIPTEVVNFFKEVDLEKIIDKGHLVIGKYLFVAVEIKDFNKEIVGYSILAESTDIIQNEINEINKLMYIFMVILVFVIFSLSVILFIFTNKVIVSPIKEVSNYMVNVSKGDFSKMLYTKRKDEIGILYKSINNTVSSLSALINKIKISVGKVDDSSKTIVGISNELLNVSNIVQNKVLSAENSIENIKGQVNNWVIAMEQMNSTIREIAKNSDNTRVIASKSYDEAISAKKIIESLSNASMKIADISKIIKDIAGQTNLLALNATIEAARAGEVGKGFVIVAQEIKELAKQTTDFTSEIDEIVNDININGTKSVKAIQSITEIIASVKEFSESVAAAIEEQTSTINEISSIAQTINKNIQLIFDEMKNISIESEKNFTVSSKTQTISKDLENVSNELISDIQIFKI